MASASLSSATTCRTCWTWPIASSSCGVVDWSANVALARPTPAICSDSFWEPSASKQCEESNTTMTNRVKDKLAAGQPTTIIAPYATSAGLVEMLGRFGFDGVFLDCEHGPASWE